MDRDYTYVWTLKRRIIRRLRLLLGKIMWPSGYVKDLPDGRSRPLRLMTFNNLRCGSRAQNCRWLKRQMISSDTRIYCVRNAIGQTVYEGFTEDGPIDDAFGGGLSYTEWESVPLEDLIKLETLVLRKHEFWQAKRKEMRERNDKERHQVS